MTNNVLAKWRGPLRRNISLDWSNDRADETILLMSRRNIDSFWYMSTITRTRAIMVPLGDEYPTCSSCMASLRPYAAWGVVGLVTPSGGSTACILLVVTGMSALIATTQVLEIDWTVRRDGVGATENAGVETSGKIDTAECYAGVCKEKNG